MSGTVLGRDYPHPIVNHATVYREAKVRMQEVRVREEARLEAAKVYRRHGSRAARR
jgi:hypothetical protein